MGGGSCVLTGVVWVGVGGVGVLTSALSVCQKQRVVNVFSSVQTHAKAA